MAKANPKSPHMVDFQASRNSARKSARHSPALHTAALQKCQKLILGWTQAQNLGDETNKRHSLCMSTLRNHKWIHLGNATISSRPAFAAS